jgi:hypothetical protein
MSSSPSPDGGERSDLVFVVRDVKNKGLLVLSVELLRRSVAVEVDGTLVVPSKTWRG